MIVSASSDNLNQHVHDLIKRDFGERTGVTCVEAKSASPLDIALCVYTAKCDVYFVAHSQKRIEFVADKLGVTGVNRAYHPLPKGPMFPGRKSMLFYSVVMAMCVTGRDSGGVVTEMNKLGIRRIAVPVELTLDFDAEINFAPEYTLAIRDVDKSERRIKRVLARVPYKVRKWMIIIHPSLILLSARARRGRRIVNDHSIIVLSVKKSSPYRQKIKSIMGYGD